MPWPLCRLAIPGNRPSEGGELLIKSSPGSLGIAVREMGFSEQRGARVRRKIGSWAISVTAAIGISSAFVLGGCGSEKAAPAVVKAGAASVPLTEKARTAEMREMMGTIAKQPISKKKAREAAVAHQRHQGFLRANTRWSSVRSGTHTEDGMF